MPTITQIASFVDAAREIQIPVSGICSGCEKPARKPWAKLLGWQVVGTKLFCPDCEDQALDTALLEGFETEEEKTPESTSKIISVPTAKDVISLASKKSAKKKVAEKKRREGCVREPFNHDELGRLLYRCGNCDREDFQLAGWRCTRGVHFCPDCQQEALKLELPKRTVNKPQTPAKTSRAIKQELVRAKVEEIYEELVAAAQARIHEQFERSRQSAPKMPEPLNISIGFVAAAQARIHEKFERARQSALRGISEPLNTSIGKDSR